MRFHRSFSHPLVLFLCMLLRKSLSFVSTRTFAVSFLFRRSMAMKDAAASNRDVLTASPLDSFLRQRQQSPSRHIVIGNEAGDADSIVSAISWAYVKSHRETTAPSSETPIISITRADLETQRPETLMLLRIAGLSTESLLYVDDPLITDLAEALDVTLVDHNRLTEPSLLAKARVVEILDHHADLQSHLEAPTRNIAYENQAATVASTCTLVVEHCEPPIPASLSILLLGVILLDSVNMLPAAGKGTERDQQAIDKLLQSTQWRDLSLQAQAVLRLKENHGVPDTTALFEALQDAKFDASFWNSLSVRDALRLDYKRFETSTAAMAFGSSSVLMSLDVFGQKAELEEAIAGFMSERGVEWLFILFSYMDNGTPKRQMMVCSTTQAVDSIVDYLLKQELLQLNPCPHRLPTATSLRFRSLDQGNPKASRKQVAPILLDYFEDLKQIKD